MITIGKEEWDAIAASSPEYRDLNIIMANQ